MSRVQDIDYLAIAPALLVALVAIGVLVLDTFLRRRAQGGLRMGGDRRSRRGAGAAAADGRRDPAYVLRARRRRLVLPSCSYVVDDLTLVFQALVLAGAVVVMLLSLDTMRDHGCPRGSTASCCSRRCPAR